MRLFFGVILTYQQLRHLACDVLALAQSYSSTYTEASLLSLCKFFSKTISLLDNF